MAEIPGQRADGLCLTAPPAAQLPHYHVPKGHQSQQAQTRPVAARPAVNAKTTLAPHASRSLQHSGGPIASDKTTAANTTAEMIPVRVFPSLATGSVGGHVADTA